MFRTCGTCLTCFCIGIFVRVVVLCGWHVFNSHPRSTHHTVATVQLSSFFPMSDEEDNDLVIEDEAQDDEDLVIEDEAAEEEDSDLVVANDEAEPPGESLIIEDEEDEAQNHIDAPLNVDEDEEVDQGAPAPPSFGEWSTTNEEDGDDDDDGGPPKPPPGGLRTTLLPPQPLPALPKRRPLTVDEDLAEWVQEYLQYRGFTNTLDCFQAEYLSRQYAVTSSQAAHTSGTTSGTTSSGGHKEEESKSDGAAVESRESVVIRSRQEKLSTLLTCFDTGDSEGFTKLWYTHIPLYVRQEDRRVQKCYFMARVQFLARCWSLDAASQPPSTTAAASSSPSPTKKKRSPLLAREMKRFRLYLEHEGGDIAGTDSSLEKYPALLYVGNPTQHASFTECFSGVGPVVRGKGGKGRCCV